jgi:zinc protease
MILFHKFKSMLASSMLVVAIFIANVSNVWAIDIQEVVTPSGIKAWLVEDYTVPLISVSMEFSGGSTQDPAGIEGVTSIMGAMMDEGAGDLDTAALKAELEERGIELGFSADRDNVSGGMKLIATEKERAFELLKMVLTAPKFEAASLERIRAGYISGAKRNTNDPDSILGKRIRETLFKDHPYGREQRGTLNSLEKITRDDIVSRHQALFARDNVYIGVVGAISKEELMVELERTLSDLPQQATLVEIPDIVPVYGMREHITFESPQTTVSLAMPGLKRNAPDFFAAHIMNHILGGGTFSSWLYEEIREKRGLVYGIGTNLVTLEHTAYLGGGFATKPDQAKDALELTLSEIKRMATDGPTQEELDAAKKFVFGTYAISNLDTSSKISNVLVGLQSSKLGIDYINKRAEFIDAVSLDDVKAIAKRLLSDPPMVITIGPGEV